MPTAATLTIESTSSLKQASPAVTPKDLRYWLALIRTPRAGKATLEALAAHDGPGALFSAKKSPVSDKKHPAGQLDPAAQAWLREPDWQRVDEDMAWLEDSGATLLIKGQPGYPPLLAEIPDAPLALFVRGNVQLLAEPQLAIVGSRNPSSGGCDTARNFASHLARAGLVITSGLAGGIDTAAHQGALKVKGATIAVCGTGLDRVYPASNHALARQISETGALVSEFPPGTPPRAQNFPSRNRILSGLSVGTLVVEAALRSGSLISARLATEQGREVFAIPGSIHNPLSRGCHRLIKSGAKLVETADDILEELTPLLTSVLQAESTADTPAAAHPDKDLLADEEDPDYATLLKIVGHDPTPVDLIVQRSGLPAGVVSSILLMLEMQDRVHALPGGRYVRGPQ